LVSFVISRLPVNFQPVSLYSIIVVDRAAGGSAVTVFVHQELAGLDGSSLLDAVELVEQSRDALDDVWRQTEVEPYPEARMGRLMDVIGGTHTDTHTQTHTDTHRQTDTYTLTHTLTDNLLQVSAEGFLAT